MRRPFSMSDYLPGTPLDPIMKRFFCVVMVGVAYLFLRILWDVIEDPWLKGFIFGGLTMFVACALALWFIINWPSRAKRRK